MRKKILQSLVSGVAAALAVVGCAHSNSDTDTSSRAHFRNYSSPPEAVREPGIPDYPCGEVLVREPSLKPRRDLVNAGDPETEHYWITAYWANTPQGWVYVPAHAEPSPGSRWQIGADTNSVTAMSRTGEVRL